MRLRIASGSSPFLASPAAAAARLESASATSTSASSSASSVSFFMPSMRNMALTLSPTRFRVRPTAAPARWRIVANLDVVCVVKSVIMPSYSFEASTPELAAAFFNSVAAVTIVVLASTSLKLIVRSKPCKPTRIFSKVFSSSATVLASAPVSLSR